MTTTMKFKKPRHKSPRKLGWLKPALLLAAVAGLLILARWFHLEDRLRDLHHWVRALGPWGPFVTVLIFALGVVLTLPGSALTLMTGLFFKTVTAVLVTTAGAALGTAAAFLIARAFARRDLSKWAAQSERFKKLDRLTEKHGAWIVAMLRLMPLSPFSVLNYAFGLTKVRFWEYLFWSSLCTLPSTVFFVVSAHALTRGIQEHQVPWPLIVVLAGITLALALLMALVERRLEKRH